VPKSKVKKVIKGCSRYKDTLDKCVRCKLGYYIGNSGQCRKHHVSLMLRSSRVKTGLSTGEVILYTKIVVLVFWFMLRG
jgi:hypothetical protein